MQFLQLSLFSAITTICFCSVLNFFSRSNSPLSQHHTRAKQILSLYGPVCASTDVNNNLNVFVVYAIYRNRVFRVRRLDIHNNIMSYNMKLKTDLIASERVFPTEEANGFESVSYCRGIAFEYA